MRERWFGATGRRVPAIALEGSLDLSGALVLDSVDPAPAGKTYEVWLLDGETPVPAGLFSGDGERDVVPVHGTVAPGARVLVTLERSGGVDAPTTTPIVASRPV